MPIRRPRSYTVYVLIALNVAVYLMWHGFGHFSPEFMEDNFTVSWQSLSEGRYWTLLTNVFSHVQLWHLVINMFVLNSFGTIMELVLGRRFFITFYLIAGIIGSIGHCAVSNFLLGQPDLPCVGASGALAGVVLIFALMFPKEKLLIFGLIPVPALWGGVLFIGLDIWGLTAQAQGGGLPIGHGAHLGGSATGILTYIFILRRRRRKPPAAALDPVTGAEYTPAEIPR